MLRAQLRVIRADLRRRPLQSALVFIVVAAATALPTLAVSVEDSAGRPFERVMETADGGHVWLFAPAAALGRVKTMDGIEATAGPFRRSSASLVASSTGRHPILAWGMAGKPEVGVTNIVEGRWLDPGTPNEIVIDKGLAHEADLEVGDVARVATARGPMELRVVGIGVHLTRAPYPNWDPADVFVSEATRAAFGTESDQPPVVGVRLHDRGTVEAFTQRAIGVTGGPAGAITWTSIRDSFAEENEPTIIVLRVFAAFGLLAVGFILANAVSGLLLVQIRDIGLLKAAGLTPGQVTRVFLGEQLVIAGLGAVAGLVIGLGFTPLILRRTASSLGTTATPVLEPVRLGAILVVVLGAVTVFTVFPAWRGARTNTVQAITVGGSRRDVRPSRLGRLATRLGLPGPVVLGAKDAFTRPARAWFTIAALTFAVATLVCTFTVDTTIGHLFDEPGLIGGEPYQVEIQRIPYVSPAQYRGDPPGAMSEAEAEALIRESSGAVGVITRRFTFARLGGDDSRPPFRFDAWAIAGDIQEAGFRVVDGRMFKGPGEAVIGLGLARETGLGVGDRVTFRIEGNTAFDVIVTGTYAEERNDGIGLMYHLDQLRSALPAIDSGAFGVVLPKGADSAVAAAAIADAAGSRLVVDDVATAFHEDLAEQRNNIRTVMTPMSVALLFIAGLNLFTTLLFAVRERVRDFAILKTIGFTPLQVVSGVGVSATVYAVIATAIGAPLGYYVSAWLFDHFGKQDGWAPGVAQVPSAPWLALVLPIAVALAVAGSAIPARLAARVGITEALAFE